MAWSCDGAAHARRAWTWLRALGCYSMFTGTELSQLREEILNSPLNEAFAHMSVGGFGGFLGDTARWEFSTLPAYIVARPWLFDILSLILPLVCLGVYSPLPFQLVQVLGSFPFLMMIFMSTTFSPGAGVAGVKGLRFLFVRFYMWCMLPTANLDLDGCPDGYFITDVFDPLGFSR